MQSVFSVWGSSFEDQIICIFRCSYSHHVFPIQTHLTVTWNNIKKWGEPHQQIHQFLAGRLCKLKFTKPTFWRKILVVWLNSTGLHSLRQCLPHPTGSPGEFCNSKKKDINIVANGCQWWIAGLAMVNKLSCNGQPEPINRWHQPYQLPITFANLPKKLKST